MSNPDDGYAYSPIELTGIWQIPVTLADMAAGLERAYEFHLHCAALPALAFEKKAHEEAVKLIIRALEAEARDPQPPNVIPDDITPENERLLQDAYKAMLERYRISHEGPTG